MPIYRFFTKTALLEPEERITLCLAETHHLAHVLRLEREDLVWVVNGQWQLAQAKIEDVGKKRLAQLRIVSVQTSAPSDQCITLELPILAPEALAWVLEKGTELGVTHFKLIATQRSRAAHFTPSQWQRMEQLIISAVKQCGRLDKPVLEVGSSIIEREFDSDQKELILFAHLSPQSRSLKDISVEPSRKIRLFIGPESGFTKEEIAKLEALSPRGAIKLHENTLRAETACISFLSQINLILQI